MLFSGNCNTEVVNGWLEHMARPYLNDNVVVVMDNAAFHKSKETERIITKTGAKLLFLPPYSPHLNPIEQTFGTIKKIRSYNQNKTLEEVIQMYQ